MTRHLAADLVVALLLIVAICAAVALVGSQGDGAQCCSCISPSL